MNTQAIEPAAAAGLRFTQIAPTFVGLVEGIDLRQPITDAQALALKQALAKYGVLVLKNQPINDDELMRVTEVFGPNRKTSFQVMKNEHQFLIDVTNVDKEGRPLPQDHSYVLYMKANEFWHSDGTFNPRPQRFTALHARELPNPPPPTEYADTQAAWDSLPAQRQRALEKLVVVHDRRRSLERVGQASVQTADPEERTARQPLVRVNEITGRKSLYVGSHASYIEGMPKEEGRRMVDELTAYATQPQFVYSHPWELHDLVIWDGSRTLHRATPYTAPAARRMRQSGALELASLL